MGMPRSLPANDTGEAEAYWQTSTKLTIPIGVAPSIAKSFWKGREGASLFLGHRAWLVH